MKNNEIILFETADQAVKLSVTMDGETVWLSRAQLSQLFSRDVSVIGRHIGAVFKEGELDRESNVQILHIPNSDRPVELYSLDVMISVGYRVKSQRGVEFRRNTLSLLTPDQIYPSMLYFDKPSRNYTNKPIIYPPSDRSTLPLLPAGPRGFCPHHCPSNSTSFQGHIPPRSASYRGSAATSRYRTLLCHL